MVGPRYALLEQRFQLEQPLRAVQKKIQEQKNYVHQKKYEQIAEIFGEIHIGEGKKGAWKDKHTGIQYGRETIERNIYDIAPDKGTAERIIGGIVQPIHDAERQRFLFIGGYKQKLRELHIDTNNNIALRLPEFGGKKVSESALVQWLGENRFQLKQMRDAGGNPEAYRELSQKITMVEDALTPEQRRRIDEGISVLQGIYKEIHPMINEVLIRNGYDPIGYIEGYFPHMDFDDPNGGMELAAKVLGFDFSSKELPMDIAGRTETFRPGKKWSGNLLERKGTETDYDALRAFDQYIDNIGDVLYHTENIQSLRAAEDYIRYSLSEDSVKQAVDKVRMDTSIPYLERQKKIEEIYEENKQNHKLQNFVNYLIYRFIGREKEPLRPPFGERIWQGYLQKDQQSLQQYRREHGGCQYQLCFDECNPYYARDESQHTRKQHERIGRGFALCFRKRDGRFDKEKCFFGNERGDRAALQDCNPKAGDCRR